VGGEVARGGCGVAIDDEFAEDEDLPPRRSQAFKELTGTADPSFQSR
jgi:hypothetical protein